MPIYAYECSACGHELEVEQSMSDAPKKTCPACRKQKLARVISGGAGFLLRGSGFYSTDNRSASYKAGEAADKKSASGGCGDACPCDV
ncbi:MAG: zinc ribbon domain-containing protein [Planctomycetota bacterium]